MNMCTYMLEQYDSFGKILLHGRKLLNGSVSVEGRSVFRHCRDVPGIECDIYSFASTH